GLLLATLALAGCAGPEEALRRAEGSLRAGRPVQALQRYVRPTHRRDHRTEMRAALGASHAAAALRDLPSQRHWLDLAAPDPQARPGSWGRRRRRSRKSQERGWPQVQR